MTRVHRLRDFTDTSACDPPILSLRTSFPIHRRLVSGLNRRFPFVVYGAGSSINAPLQQIEQNALAKNSQHAMNLLNHLWDDTVAGPPPEDGGGLGKLRKFSTFNSRPDSRNESENPNQRSLTVDTADDGMKVTRSIKILKSPRNQSKDSPPSSPSPSPSPAGSTPPVSPFSFSGLGGREAYRFRRKSASHAYENARGIGPRSPPPPYDM